jgi:hypothetical protein
LHQALLAHEEMTKFCSGAPGFNGQIKSSSEHHVIVAVDIDASGSNRGLAQPEIENVHVEGYEPSSYLVDGGFAKNDDITSAHANDINMWCPPGQRSVRWGVVSMHTGIHSGGTGIARHSPRNGFNRLSRAPRDRAFLPPSSGTIGASTPGWAPRDRANELDASIGAPGPHALTVRNTAGRLARRSRSRLASPCDHMRTRQRHVHRTPPPRS